jgi:hypothetical protein
MIVLTGYDTLKQTAKSLNQQVKWDFLFTMFVQQVLTFVEQMEHQMIISMLRVFDTRYVDQGGGKRKVVLLFISKLADIF